jgi:hypothetical protein
VLFMGLLPISSFLLNDPNYRFAILYSIIDRTICEVLSEEFGQVHIRFQVKIENKKINVMFFYLDKYYLTFMVTNQKEIQAKTLNAMIARKLAPKNYFTVFFKYAN